jgi:hypothetical protein
VAFADEYIPYYATFEFENLQSLKLGRIEALLNLNRLDDAATALNDPKLPGNPVTDIEFYRLRQRLENLRKDITTDGTSAPPPISPGKELMARAHAAMQHIFKGTEDQQQMGSLIDQLSDSQLDVNNPKDYQHLLDLLKKGEDFMRRGNAGGDSQLSIRGRIREACGIFVTQTTPPRAAIEQSLSELTSCLEWSEKNGVVELQNDALWGIYLCRSRLNQMSPAADALLKLRANLEATRSAITDETRRGEPSHNIRIYFPPCARSCITPIEFRKCWRRSKPARGVALQICLHDNRQRRPPTTASTGQ